MRKLFGTNGIRGIVNETLTPELALGISKALGTYLGPDSIVALGRDTRLSGDMLSSAAVSGLLSTGVDVVDVGVVPTPTLQHFVRDNAHAGLMITASHNPREYNGLKVIAGDGTELDHSEEEKIEEIYFSKSYRCASWDSCGVVDRKDAITPYIQSILERVDVESVADTNFKVVCDTGCGAGGVVLPYLLERMGCKVITLNSQLDGHFPGREPEPIQENLGELIELVKSSGADLGVAQDGDADRAVFVDEKGRYVDGDTILAIFADYILSHSPPNSKVVTPVSTSLKVVDVVEKKGEIVWTPVGSIHVARMMIKTGAVFGGEGNGGLIFPEHQYCRDGAMATAKMLELLAHEGKHLSELVDNTPKYVILKHKIPFNKDFEVKLDDKLLENAKIERIDGVKVWFDDGWVLVRPSGTEPIVRIYAESRDEKRARELLEFGLSLVK